ncbi:rhamnulokinase [Clostridiales bacterium COT073_COT-073]|nr:rhamnulokinase [Clostridiales bacterium COT073_COT-073]
MKKNMVAFDCGNSSCRVILGIYDGKCIKTEVILQVPNYMVRYHNYFYWDILMIYHKLLEGLKEVQKKVDIIHSIGICTWGVDFAPFDKEGFMLQNPLSYRNTVGAEMLSKISDEQQRFLFEETGILCDKINSLYMIKALAMKMPQIFSVSDKILMIPDILNYMFTGNMLNEPSEFSTTQLMNVRTQKISERVLENMNIPQRLFPDLGKHGEKIGNIRAEIKEYLDIKYDIPVICVPSHDTAAAVLAVPAKEEEFIFISLGTWALIGMELEKPIITEEVRKSQLTNEIGAFQKITLLRNSAGMFIIQRLKAEYEKEYSSIPWEDFNDLARGVCSPVPLFPVNENRFFNPVSMADEIWKYFKETGQVNTEKNWAVIVAAFQYSMAFNLCLTVEKLEKVSKKQQHKIYLVGGGSQNKRLCQLIANVSGKKVVIGAKESTSLGNLGAQLKFFEKQQSIQDIRDIIEKNIEKMEYICQERLSTEMMSYRNLLS